MSWLLPCSLGSSSACFMTNVCQLYNCHLYNCHRDRASIRLSICATVIVRKVARTRLVFCTTVTVTKVARTRLVFCTTVTVTKVARTRLVFCTTVTVTKVARTRLVFCTTVTVTQGADAFGYVYNRDRGVPAGSCSTMKGGGGWRGEGETENCTEEVLAERGVFSVPSYFRRSCEGCLSSLHRATLGAGTVSLIPS